MTALKYLRLLGVTLRVSVLHAVQYRSDFLFDALVQVAWAVTAVLPLFVVLGGGERKVGGWSYDEALVVLGWFTVIQTVLEGAVAPSIGAVVEHVRKGTLDFVLLKPKDAQFLVSTARFYPFRCVNFVTALVIFAVAFARLGRLPSLSHVLASLVLLADGIVVLYALLVLTVSVAFYAVRVDNLTFLLDSVFDAARWPASAFRGVVRFIFTYVIPLVLMTTFPAEALLGTLRSSTLVFSTSGAFAFGVMARLTWRRAIRAYTSAGG